MRRGRPSLPLNVGGRQTSDHSAFQTPSKSGASLHQRQPHARDRGAGRGAGIQGESKVFPLDDLLKSQHYAERIFLMVVAITDTFANALLRRLSPTFVSEYQRLN